MDKKVFNFHWLSKIPPLPSHFQNISSWVRLILGIFALLASAITLYSRLFAPQFYVEYAVMDSLPLSTLVNSLGKEDAPIPREAKILRLHVVNKSTKNEAANVVVTVKGTISKLLVIRDVNGQPLDTIPQIPFGETPSLQIKIGDMRPATETVIYVVGIFYFFFDPMVEVSSSTLGLGTERIIGEVSGVKLFVANNLELIAVLVFLLFSVVILTSIRRV